LEDLHPNLRIECTPTTITFVTPEAVTPEAAVQSSESNVVERRPSNVMITVPCRCPECGISFDSKWRYEDHVLETHTTSLDIRYNYEGIKLKDSYLPI
jgi:uncharacterized C2H2 Zn-finger protein